MFFAFSSAIFLLSVASGAFATPQATSTASLSPSCIGTYGPFQLFAKLGSTGASYPIRLVVDETTSTNSTSHMIIDTDESCINCGVQPTYWNLKKNKLLAVDSSAPAGTTTINLDVTKGSLLDFITSRKSQPAYPIYCAETTGTDTPPILSLHNSSTQFTMCAFTSVVPPPTIFSIQYDHFNVQPVGVRCSPVKLVLQFIGVQ